jgi:hypothetical protein
MGHARCDRAVRLLHQASSSDRAGAGSHGWTSPVQDTHAGQSFSGSHPPPPVPARDHHRTTGSLTVILAVIPQATTAPNQTGLTRIVDQPELPRPYWTGLSGRLAVIS